MKPQTKSLAKVVKQAILEFPPSDLLELIDYWISVLDNNLIGLENIDEIKLTLGYQLVDEESLEFTLPTPKAFYHKIQAMNESDFYHLIIWLAGQVVNGCGEPPNSYNDGYEFMSNLATRLYQITRGTARPAKIAKVMFNYD